MGSTRGSASSYLRLHDSIPLRTENDVRLAQNGVRNAVVSAYVVPVQLTFGGNLTEGVYVSRAQTVKREPERQFLYSRCPWCRQALWWRHKGDPGRGDQYSRHECKIRGRWRIVGSLVGHIIIRKCP